MNKSMSSTSSSTGSEGNKEAVVEQAKQAVTNVAGQAREQVTSQLTTQFDNRKDKAVETMSNVADAIRDTSDKLKGVGPLGDVAERAADGIERMAGFFEGKQIGDLVRDANRFARREPAIFLGAAFALGLIGGRFLKSSVRQTGTSQAGGGMSRDRGGDYRQYEGYGGSYDAYDDARYDDDGGYLADDDLEDADSMRFGTYGTAQRGSIRDTLPQGSSTVTTRSTTSYGASQSTSPSGGSYGATQGATQGSSPGTTPTTSSTQGATQGSAGSSTSIGADRNGPSATSTSNKPGSV